MAERLNEEEILQEENKRIAQRIKGIVKDIKSTHPELNPLERDILFVGKEGLSKALVLMRVYPERQEPLPGFTLFEIPNDFDFPVYSMGLRPEDYGGDLMPADAEVLDPWRVMWVDRNLQMCEYHTNYLFSEEGKGIFINYGFEDDFPMDEDEIPPYEAHYQIDLDIVNKETKSRDITWGDQEKVNLILKQIETGYFHLSPI